MQTAALVLYLSLSFAEIVNMLSTLCLLGKIVHAFLSSDDFFFKINLFEKFFRENNIKVSNSLDPDQARLFVWHDLGPNCLQRLSAEDTSRQRVALLCCIF